MFLARYETNKMLKVLCFFINLQSNKWFTTNQTVKYRLKKCYFFDFLIISLHCSKEMFSGS